MLSRKYIFGVITAVSIAVRSVFFALFSGSLFTHYHCVTGLDMQTLLRFSEWGGGENNPPFFTLHRVVIFLIWKFNGMVHQPMVLFFIQNLFGIIGALATADIVLMLCGRKRAALWAGIAYAVYLPFLVYEFSVLQETFAVNLMLLSVWGVLFARKKHFSFPASLSAGLFWGLALNGRPAGILLAPAVLIAGILYSRRKKSLRRFAVIPAAAVVILTLIGVCNAFYGAKTGPFYNTMSYILAYNVNDFSAEKAADPTVSPQQNGKILLPEHLLISAASALKRLPFMLSVRELPENQNIYFWREKIPELHLLPGPELLLVLAVFGGIILLFSPDIRPRGTLILLTMLLLALPLCAREPIGRYRLMLCPYLIVTTALGITELLRIRSRKRKYYAVTSGVICAMATVGLSYRSSSDIRHSDYMSWAIASEARYGHCEETLERFYELWKITAYRSDRAFAALCRQAFFCRQQELVRSTVRQAELAGGVEPSLTAYFTGLIYVGENNPQMVLQAFQHIVPEKLPADLRKNYFQVRTDAIRIMRARSAENRRKTN